MNLIAGFWLQLVEKKIGLTFNYTQLYCSELQYFFGRGETVNEVVEQVRQTLLEELQNRNAYKNLHNLGWKITDTSIKVPTFTDAEAVSLTEQSYEITISNYQIVKIDVEVPPARKLW